MSMIILQPYKIEYNRQLITNLPTEQSTNRNLACLNHAPIVVNETGKPGSDPSKTILEHQSPAHCGSLKRNWLHNPPLSDFAKQLESHQSNCSIPLATHHFDNTFGLGSHFILWGQALCNGMEARSRMRSHAPEWLWLDQEHCDMNEQAVVSPMLCYFPASEHRCSSVHESSTVTAENSNDVTALLNITDPRKQKQWCQLAKESEESRAMIRASSTEYLFQRLSPLVIREAKRQIGIIFPNGVVPEDMVTVHIRWGDKFWEMDLPPIQEYITAVHEILSSKSTLDGHTTANATTANIYLATEGKNRNEFVSNATQSTLIRDSPKLLNKHTCTRKIPGRTRNSWRPNPLDGVFTPTLHCSRSMPFVPRKVIVRAGPQEIPTAELALWPWRHC